jgi:hypothetical protein
MTTPLFFDISVYPLSYGNSNINSDQTVPFVNIDSKQQGKYVVFQIDFIKEARNDCQSSGKETDEGIVNNIMKKKVST